MEKVRPVISNRLRIVSVSKCSVLRQQCTVVHYGRSLVGSKQQVSVKMMDYVPKLPVAYQYSFTPRNYLVEDEKVLHNIPYFSDDKVDLKENKSLGELVSSYSKPIRKKNPCSLLNPVCV